MNVCNAMVVSSDQENFSSEKKMLENMFKTILNEQSLQDAQYVAMSYGVKMKPQEMSLKEDIEYQIGVIQFNYGLTVGDDGVFYDSSDIRQRTGYVKRRVRSSPSNKVGSKVGKFFGRMWDTIVKL